ncbi:hypothetical protein [Nocardia sp. CNY236]|uniref:hypothetical protein n=1 Tax=Nocardia sp. CNY236 TaxID=1169152 RepID=UPI0004276982|nr:hypothetical protein [Nocardia sp. CNY236]
MTTVLAVAALWSLVAIAVLPVLLALVGAESNAARQLRRITAVSSILLAAIAVTLSVRLAPGPRRASETATPDTSDLVPGAIQTVTSTQRAEVELVAHEVTKGFYR